MNLAEMLAMADQAVQSVETNTDFELLKPGVYDFAVTNCEGPLESARTSIDNPNEHGQYLKIEATVTGPTCVGRKVWFNNNIICFPKSATEEDRRKAATAMAMGSKERKILLDSIGKTGIQMAAELIGATFKGMVIIEKGTNGYKDRNGISSIKPINSAIAAPAVTQSAPTPVSAPSAASSTNRAKMPWEK